MDKGERLTPAGPRRLGNRFALHYAYIILAVAFINVFASYAARLGYGVVLPHMIRSLGFSRTGGGTVYNAYLFAYLTLAPFAGYFTDRFGAKTVITVCAFILGCGLLMTAAAGGLASACLFYAVVGVGASGLWTPVVTLVQRWFVRRRRGRALAVLSVGYGLGFAVVGGVFPFIVSLWNWRYLWVFLGTFALITALLDRMLLVSDPADKGLVPWGGRDSQSEATGPDLIDTGVTLSTLWKSSVFRRIGVSYFFAAFALYGITTFMIDYAEGQLGFSAVRAGRLATIHGMCQIAGVLCLLPLSDIFGRKRTLMFTNALLAVALTGILLAGKSLAALYFMVGLAAVSYGATFPLYGACAGDYFPRPMMGTVLGIWTPLYGIGAVSAHWVVGAIRDFTGVYEPAFLITVISAALAALLMTTVSSSSYLSNH